MLTSEEKSACRIKTPVIRLKDQLLEQVAHRLGHLLPAQFKQQRLFNRSERDVDTPSAMLHSSKIEFYL
ncbi:hypothetical protein [Propionivibrio sp.]|uniref:hypothetical protein n=1 Tax=Propionivibrio sp. TaxID=2212460 RepID=UPI003BF3050D